MKQASFNINRNNQKDPPIIENPDHFAVAISTYPLLGFCRFLWWFNLVVGNVFYSFEYYYPLFIVGLHTYRIGKEYLSIK